MYKISEFLKKKYEYMKRDLQVKESLTYNYSVFNYKTRFGLKTTLSDQK